MEELAGGGLTGGLGGGGGYSLGNASATSSTGPIDTTTNMKLAGSEGGQRGTVYNVAFPGAYMPGPNAINSPDVGSQPWFIIGGIGAAILVFILVLFKKG